MIKVLTEDLADDIKHIVFIFRGIISFSANSIRYRADSSDIAKSEYSEAFTTRATSLDTAIRNFKIRAFKYKGFTKNYGTMRASFTGSITINYCYGYEEVVRLESGNRFLTNQIEGISYPIDTRTVTISKELATKYEVPRNLTREQAIYVMLEEEHAKTLHARIQKSIDNEDSSKYIPVKVRVHDPDKNLWEDGTATLDTEENTIYYEDGVFPYVEDEGVYCLNGVPTYIRIDILK